MWFKNSDKEMRALAVIKAPNTFSPESVERVALAKAMSEKLEGEELVARVYEIMGGAIGTDAEKVVVEGKKTKRPKKA